MLPGRERIELDAAEDRRQGDDDDRPVERRHEHGGVVFDSAIHL